jgi:hypothetical protein
MGPYAGVDYDLPYFKVNSVVSYPPPLQRGRGAVGKISPIYLLIFRTTNKKRARGRERGRVDLMSLNRHFMEHGHWATPCLSGL